MEHKIEIASILFDLDGALVDSVPWHEEALNRALEETCGFRLGSYENEEIFTGKLTKDKLHILQNQGRVSVDHFESIISLKKKHLEPVIQEMALIDPEKQELQEKILRQGYRIACVTNSNKEAALLVLQAIDQLKFFEFVITGEDVVNHKPCGEGYVTAMVLLQALPRKTIIIEDSALGIQAAKSIGAHVWAVGHPSEVTWVNFQNFLEEIR